MTAEHRLAELADGIPTAAATSDGASYRFGVGNTARFQACSISKPVGAVVALTLVADGLLGLDDDVAPLLRSWTVPSLGDWTPRITLRHLLSHSAGLTVHGFPGVPGKEPLPSLVDILEGRSNTPPVVADLPPGLLGRYSGGGYVLLQVLVEDLTGLSYADLADERVLRPAGMTRSGFDDPAEPAPALRVDGRPVGGGPRRYAALVGGLWTVPEDLVAFARAVQQRALLPADLHDALLVEEQPGRGLGFELWSGGRFGHGGANEGYRCRLVADRDGAYAAAVMTGSDAGSRVCLRLLNALAEQRGWDWEPLPEPVDARTWVAQVGGELVDDRGRTWRLTRDGSRLLLTLPGQPPVELEPTGRTSLLVPAWDGELALEWAGDRVVSVELRQAGHRFQARAAAS